jgi:phosphohistidine swiveling domain-containing protein
MIHFEKVYTRDTTIIMQEAWSEGLLYGLEARYGWINPHHPLLIQFVNDGVIEFWENIRATEWLKDRLQEELRRRPDFLSVVGAEYEQEVRPLRPYWQRISLSSASDLESYLVGAFDATVSFIPQFYSAVDERTPDALRQVALHFRESDTFFANSDTLVRESLLRMFPQLRGLETLVQRSEIWSPPDRAVLEKRRRNMILIAGQVPETVSLREYATRHENFEFLGLQPKAFQTSEVRGQTAFPGLVRGTVTILKLKDDVDRVANGAVLVSPMTTPDFLPAMIRAAAFVTDEGGVTCHAAIISREMRKPCVVGTSFATEVFRDGDLVEVDANQGIVRLLRRQ